MPVLSKAEIAALSTEERLALIDDLWESLEAAQLETSADEVHRRILEQRLASYDPASEEQLSLDEICARLRSR